MFSSNVYNTWENVKNNDVDTDNIKRYIKIQFKRLGISNFKDIIDITNSDIDYYNILLIIISYYKMEFVSKKMYVKNIQ
jgi:hypothetical protein